MDASKKFLKLRSVLNLFGEHGDHFEGKAHLDIGSSEFLAGEPCADALAYQLPELAHRCRSDPLSIR